MCGHGVAMAAVLAADAADKLLGRTHSLSKRK